jgi:excisionase family DNA binding protein
MPTDQRKAELILDGLDRIKQAAQFLGISRSQTYLLMDAGELPFVKIGRSRRIPHRALIEFAARNLTGDSKE